MIDVNKYIRIPYADKGRSFDGCDCFGLAILIHHHELGHKITDVLYSTAEDPQMVARLIDTTVPTINAEQVEQPEAGDLVLMRVGGMPAHIGVYLGDGKCIHTSRHYGTCCERIDGPRLKGHVMGYYRVA